MASGLFLLFKKFALKRPNSILTVFGKLDLIDFFFFCMSTRLEKLGRVDEKNISKEIALINGDLCALCNFLWCPPFIFMVIPH